MKRLRCALVLAWVVVSAGAAGSHARSLPARDFTGRVNHAVKAGEIGPAQADLYRLYALLAPDRLPVEYRFVSGLPAGAARAARRAEHRLEFRCATPALRHLWARRASWPPEVRDEADQLLRRLAPSGRPRARTAAKTTEEHTLPNWIETANFSIEWDQTLTNEDGSTPLRDADGDGIPDVAELWASYFEASYSAMLKILQPGAPDSVFLGTPVETQRIPVLIQTLSGGVYGFTLAPDPAVRPTPSIAVNNDFSFLAELGIENDEGKADPDDPLANIHGAMKVTAAHELFHVVHFLYEDPSDATSPSDDWWWEASSVWLEDEVFDQVNDYIQYFEGSDTGREPTPGETDVAGGWATTVESGLIADISSSASQLYGGVIFPKYLSEHQAGQASMGRIWSLIREGNSALDALGIFAEDLGFDGTQAPPGLEGLYLGFAASNANMDQEYEEGERYGSVPIRGETLDASGVTENLPEFLGSTYRQQTGKGGALRVSLEGLPAKAWGLSLRVVRSGPDRALALGALDPEGTPSVDLASFEPGATVTAAVSSLESGTAPTSYSTFASQSQTVDTTPPAAVDGLTLTPVAGGLNVAWTAATDDSAVAGYVVRVQPESGPSAKTRSIFGPVTAVEVRALDPQTYVVEVRAYDTSGNEGPARVENAVVTQPAPATPTPVPPIEGEQIGGSGDSDGGGDGGRGIGQKYGLDEICFIRALGL